jgi:hypothetical protein
MILERPCARERPCSLILFTRRLCNSCLDGTFIEMSQSCRLPVFDKKRQNVARRSKMKKIIAITALALTVSACGSSASTLSVAHSHAANPTVSAASPTPTVSAAGPVGTWDVTYGAPAVVSITESGSLYTITATTAINVVGSECYLPVGTKLATFSATGPGTYSGQHGLWYTTNCSFASWTPTTFTLSGSTLTAHFSSGSSTPVIFTRAGSTPVAGTPTFTPSAVPSSTPTAVPSNTPSAAASDSPVGTWNAQYGYPTVVSITESGSLYTITAVGDVEPVGVSCILPVGTKLATFSVTGPGTYSGQQGTWSVSNNHCVSTGRAQATLTLSGNTLKMPSTDPNDPEPITFYRD